jgi:hypothetical protein
MVGAILFVKVPATIITSACLGEARITIPNRSMSYRLIAACIISTAQQANPKVSGHSEPALAQDITEINLVEIHSSFIIKDMWMGLRTMSAKTCVSEIF